MSLTSDALRRVEDAARGERAETAAAPRLGRLAILAGHLTADQLTDALAEQSRLAHQGHRRRLGEILVERKWIAPDVLAALLRTQGGGLPARFELHRELGEGGMGVVYEARDVELDRRVALKILKPRAGSGARTRLEREARAAARLSHPNVVTVYDYGVNGDQVFIVMELLSGLSMRSAMREGLSLADGARMLERVSRGVQHAHDRGIIHRDLKPDNILIGPAGHPKVADFGLAHLTDSAVTATGAVLGTPLYMAPEQVSGRTGEIGPWSDIYTLGVILYEVLTGTLPFNDHDVRELYRRILTDEPASPRRLCSTVPPDLEVICLKAMQKDRYHRFTSALEFADELKRWQEGEPIRSRPTARWTRIARRLRRHTALTIALAALLVVLPGFGGTMAFVQARNRRGRQLEAIERKRREAELLRLGSLWTTLLERKRELRCGLVPVETARRRLAEAVGALDDCIAALPDEPQAYLFSAPAGSQENVWRDARSWEPT